MFQIVASSQQDSAKSIKNEIGHLGDKIADVKAALVASNPHAAEPPKAALVSALECQHLISSAFNDMLDINSTFGSVLGTTVKLSIILQSMVTFPPIPQPKLVPD